MDEELSIINMVAKPSGSGWIASGSIEFRLGTARTPRLPPISLRFDFVDAPNRAEAIRQCASRLKEVSLAFGMEADRLLQPS